jgi:3-keto-5-aminohexanoate cleavage enzyme
LSINWEWVREAIKKEEFKYIFAPYGLPEVTDITVTEFGPTKGVEVCPKWDIPEKIIIHCAITGAFYSKRQNPNHPITPDEIRQSAEECLKAGAPSVHIHVRDKRGYNVLDPELFHYVIDYLRSKYPDRVYDGCMVPMHPGEWEKMIKCLKDGLFEVTPVNTTVCYCGDTIFVKPPHVFIEKTRICQELGVKPQVAVYTDGDIDNARRYLIKTGLLEKPYYWIILPALPGGSPLNYNPFAMAEGLLHLVKRIRDVDREVHADPESVIMVCAAGRASSYLATLAILLGLHIRVGMEDTIYMWPHKDDRIKSNAEVFLTFKNIAESLGRKVVTPDEYRKMIGLPMKSKRS